MKKIFLLMLLGLFYSLGMKAQYFNTPLFNAGFNSAEELNQWVEETSPSPGEDNTYWKLEEAPRSFSEIDPSSTNTLKFESTTGSQFLSVLTSPEIDATGKKGLAVGFYHANFMLQAFQKVFYFIEISADNGAVRDTIFNSQTDTYKGTSINGWRYMLTYLPSKYDNKKLKFRLIVDAREFTGNRCFFYLDGLYLTHRFENDAHLSFSNMQKSNPNMTTNDRVFSNAETITVKLKNNGLKEIESIDLAYQVDDNVPVKETFTPAKAILMGDSVEYTFKTKADFGKFRTIYKFKTWTELAGDLNHANDTIAESLQNITTDVPYIPQFWFEKNGYINLDTDQWATEENYNSGWWRMNATPKPGYCYIDFSRAAEDCNAVLRSRPIYFKAGVKYEMRFNAYTYVEGAEALEDNQKNKLAISITKDPNGLENLTEIWKNEALDRENGLNSSVRFEVPEDAAYFVSFKCTSPKTAKELRIRDFYFVTAPRKDAKIMEVVAPVSTKYMFDSKEVVEIAVLNNGLDVISANTLKVCAQLNGGDVIEETIPESIPVNTTLKYTFKNTVDLSDLSQKHKLGIWTSLPGDENLLNDSIAKVVENKVSGIPYIADFTTDDAGNFPQEKEMWEIVDANEDGHTFIAEKAQWGNNFFFSYGGSEEVSIPATNEFLYSRPVKLEAGANYRIQYSANIMENTAGVLHLKTSLYKITDGVKTETKVLFEENISSYNSQEHITNIEEGGVYVIGYHVQSSEPIDYSIRINNLKVIKTAETDIALDEILMAGKYLSAYRSLPIGVKVSNPGINAIESFSVSVSSPSLGTKTQEFKQVIQPLNYTYVYLDENMNFTGTEDETVSVKVSMENDGFESNNTKEFSISYLENAALPYSAEFQETEGFLAIDKNKDSRRFKAFETTEGVLQQKIHGYSISGDLEEDGDLLMSRGMVFEAEKVYKLSFDYVATNTSVIMPLLEVYALNVNSGERIPVATVVNDGKYDTKCQYLGYFSVPANEVYTICFAPAAGDHSIKLNGMLEVAEVEDTPDVAVTAIRIPAEDAVFNEKVDMMVMIKNNSSLPLMSVPFSCQVADTVYYSSRISELEPGVESEVYFSGVDMFTPGDYTFVIKAEIPVDKTPDDNVFTKTIKSLPVIEMEMRSLDSPKSGTLTATEAIVISLSNNGKGAISNVPVHYSVTHVENETKVESDETVATEIPEGETLQFTFDKKVDMSVEGTYTIAVYVSVPDETVLTNDTIRTSVVSTRKIFDVGVVSVVDPVDGSLSTEEQVTVELKNFGEVDMYDIPVFAKIEKDGTLVKELTGVVNKCLLGETVNYTFTDKVDMQQYGEYVITAYSKGTNDLILQNDTCITKVKALKVDCGVIEIQNPGNECAIGKQPVTIVVKNFGEVELTDIPVRFKVGTMPQAGVIGQTLAPGETVVYTFPTEYNFRSEKEYTLTAYTELESDMDKENDSVSKILKVVSTGIHSESTVNLQVYPNPVKEMVYIKADNELLKTVAIYDQKGNLQVKEVNIQNEELALPVTQLSNGLYLLYIETETGNLVRKLFKVD